jgi:hypothetical protein
VSVGDSEQNVKESLDYTSQFLKQELKESLGEQKKGMMDIQSVVFSQLEETREKLASMEERLES